MSFGNYSLKVTVRRLQQSEGEHYVCFNFIHRRQQHGTLVVPKVLAM